MRKLLLILLACSSYAFSDIYLKNNYGDNSISIGYKEQSETIYSYEENLPPLVNGLVAINQGQNQGLFLQLDLRGGNCGYKGFLAIAKDSTFELKKLDCTYWKSIGDSLLLSFDRTKFIGLCGLPTSRSMWPYFPVINKIDLALKEPIFNAPPKDLLQSTAAKEELEKFRAFVLEHMNLDQLQDENQRAFCGRLDSIPLPDLLEELAVYPG
ncbi:hypothetical protein KO489_12615 [Reinekea forsetii]|nr:hypothetical protein [Reinekea forsetii]